jgi:hypothetical protein
VLYAFRRLDGGGYTTPPEDGIIRQERALPALLDLVASRDGRDKRMDFLRTVQECFSGLSNA